MKLKSTIKSLLKRMGLDIVTQYDLSMSSLDMAIDTVVGNQIAGDYLEFGVYKGLSFARAYNRFKRSRSEIGRQFFAFDSFMGLPESDEEFKPTQYRSGAYAADQSQFLTNLERWQVNLDQVKPIAGFYNETLVERTKKENGIENAAVVYIDCDLYDSAVLVFDFITDLLQTGTVIVIDDWFRHRGIPGSGIQKACNDWLGRNQNIKLHMLHQWRRIAFVVEL